MLRLFEMANRTNATKKRNVVVEIDIAPIVELLGPKHEHSIDRPCETTTNWAVMYIPSGTLGARLLKKLRDQKMQIRSQLFLQRKKTGY